MGTAKTVDLKYYAPAFSISVNNTELAQDISKAIVSVRVNEKLDTPSESTISVNDEFSLKTQRFEWLDNDLFRVGNRIEISMGYAGNLNQMISGKITSLESSFFSNSAPTLTMIAKDPLHIITKKTDPEDRQKFNNAASQNVKDSDIAGFISQFISQKLNVSLSTEIEPTTIQHTRVQLRGDTSFYEFLRDRASRIYYEFYIRGNKFYFISPKTDRKETLTLKWGSDLISFKPNISSSELVTEVNIRSRNSSTGEDIEGSARTGSEKKQEQRELASQLVAKFYEEVKEIKKEITNIPVFSQAEADEVAKAQLNKASDSLITGDAETIGIPELRPGVSIKLDNLGKWFSGKYYVTEATHIIDNNGYRTRFKVRRNAL